VKLRIIAVGTRLPSWADEAVAEYAKRLPRHCRLEVVALPAAKRPSADPVAREAQALLQAAGNDELIALDRRGQSWTSEALAARLARWKEAGRDVAFVIGGADGLDALLLRRAGAVWSLSALTLAHALARVLVAEQLYRAYSIDAGLPYHRA
jgi:23S rRNA (pseudouridine1915-N3)-methyltransferase